MKDERDRGYVSVSVFSVGQDAPFQGNFLEFEDRLSILSETKVP